MISLVRIRAHVLLSRATLDMATIIHARKSDGKDDKDVGCMNRNYVGRAAPLSSLVLSLSQAFRLSFSLQTAGYLAKWYGAGLADTHYEPTSDRYWIGTC